MQIKCEFKLNACHAPLLTPPLYQLRLRARKLPFTASKCILHLETLEILNLKLHMLSFIYISNLQLELSKSINMKLELKDLFI